MRKWPVIVGLSEVLKYSSSNALQRRGQQAVAIVKADVAVFVAQMQCCWPIKGPRAWQRVVCRLLQISQSKPSPMDAVAKHAPSQERVISTNHHRIRACMKGHAPMKLDEVGHSKASQIPDLNKYQPHVRTAAFHCKKIG